MRFLFTYSPVFVLVVWGTWVIELGRSNLSITVGLFALAGSMWLHVHEERRGKR